MIGGLNTRFGSSQKSPNLHYLTVTFGIFEQFLANHIWLLDKTEQFQPLAGACLAGRENNERDEWPKSTHIHYCIMHQ